MPPKKTCHWKCQGRHCRFPSGHEGAHSFEVTDGRDRERKRAVVVQYGDDWSGHKEASEQGRSRQYERNSTVKIGHEHTVEKLIARRETNGSARYLVRWQGTSHKDDTWERAENIESSCVEEFFRSEYKRATVQVRKQPQTWLIETVVDRRVRASDGTPQSKVRWLGYGQHVDAWVDDADIKQPPTGTRPPAPAPCPKPAVKKAAKAAVMPPTPLAPAPRAPPPRVQAPAPAVHAPAALPSTAAAPRKRPAPDQGKTSPPHVKHARPPEVPGTVEGLPTLMDGIDDAVANAALDWCRENNVRKTSLIAELGAQESFIAALPMNPSGLGANALRARLAKLRTA